MSKHEYFQCNICKKNDEEHPDLEIYSFDLQNREQYQLTPASTHDDDDDFHICIKCIEIIKKADIMVGGK
jgi:hypothetical protein